mgnify:CR=1 FL=1
MKRYTFTLEETELAAVRNVQEIFRSKHLILCTSCRYCTDGCPQHISIPDLFAIMNTKQLYHDWRRPHRARTKGVRLSGMRQMRNGLSAAPAHPPASEGRGKGV